MREKEQIEQDKKLISILRKYLQTSSDSFDEHQQIKGFKSYYYGNQKDKLNANTSVGSSSNLIKPLIDTKVTLILDNKITTSITPKNISFANFDRVKDMKDIADIINDCKNQIFDDNQINLLKKEVTKKALITNNGIVKVYWDEDSKEEGDVKIESIDTENVFVDPNSKTIEDSTYIILRTKQSVLTLKKKYPQFSDELDNLANKSSSKSSDGSLQTDKFIITTKTAESVQQKYYGNNTSIQSLSKVIDVFEFYCQDDTVFMPEKNDPELETKEEQIITQQLAYPNGRCIIFCGDNIVLEDKSMPNPFINFVNETGDIIFQPISLIKDLSYLQDRINHAWAKVRQLIQQTISMIALDGASGIIPSDIINQSAILLNPYSLRDGLAPQIIQNNTITAVNEMLNYINTLKQQMYEVARINPMMINGEKASGVTSGQQIAALNESPLTAIRDSQTQFADFMVRLTNKVIDLIQKNYSLGRIVKITTNEDQYAKIPLQEEGKENDIVIYNEAMEEVKRIKGTINLGEYTVKIIAGTQMPMSKTAYSQTTLQLVNMGVFDDPRTSIDSKELILEALDYPNRRAIVKKMEDKQSESQGMPPPEPPIEKIKLSFKDLELFPEAQQKILVDNGMMNQPQPEPMNQVRNLGLNQAIDPNLALNNISQ